MGLFNKLFQGKNIKELEQLNLSLLKKLSYLQKELEEKTDLINNISTEKAKPKSDYSKQWILMEKNLRNLQEENRILKDKIEKSNKILPNNQWKYSYKVDINTFFSANKYSKLRDTFLEKGIIFLQDINEEMFNTFFNNEKFVKDAYSKFINYKNNKIDWEIKTYLIKGDKITKIFQKSRKFLNVLAENNIEFMIDLDKFNFQKLTNYGFSQEEIESFNNIYKTYNSEKKLS